MHLRREFKEGRDPGAAGLHAVMVEPFSEGAGREGRIGVSSGEEPALRSGLAQIEELREGFA